MERSIADELYPDMLKPTNVNPGHRLTTDKALDSSIESEGDDQWYEDEACDSTEKLGKACDMDREWQRRREQFHTIGYRDGLLAGKDASVQEGFNAGFKESVFVGHRWGVVRGVTSALASLPDAVREKLMEIEEKRKRMQHLHESVQRLSTNDMLKLFYDDLQGKSSDQGKNAQINCQRGSEENVLENYVQEFSLLVGDSPIIKVQLVNDE